MKQHSNLGWNLRLYLLLVALFLMLPLVIVVVVAFSTSNFVTFPPPGYSLRWMERVLSDPAFMRPMWNSIKLGFHATVISGVLAVPAALAMVRHRFPGAQAMQSFLLSPLSMPTLILAIALLFFLARIGLGNTYTGLLLGHVVITLPYMVRTMVAVYASTDPRIEEAAYTLGATPVAALWHVTLPMLRPAIFAGGIFAFLISFDEVAIALLLASAASITLPVSILTYLMYNYDPAVAAISVVKMVIVVVALAVLERFYGLGNLTLPASGKEGGRNG